MERRETEPENERSLTRELRLARRRSRLPWVYSVPPAAASPGPPLRLSPQEGGHVERRACLEDVLSCGDPSLRSPKTRERQRSTTGRRLTPTVGAHRLKGSPAA